MVHESGLRPRNLILRCYAQQDPDRSGQWIAHCIDLDLSAGGRTALDARASLHEAVRGYLETVFDTKDEDSIPDLLRRRAPFWEVARWNGMWLFLRLRSTLRRADGGPSSRAYQDALPLAPVSA